MSILYIPFTDKCDWYEVVDGNYERVKNAARNPSTKFLTKEEVPLWAFYMPIDNPTLGYYGKTKFITENFKGVYALLMDFDDGITIDEAIEMHKDFEFTLYTSFRHKDDHHKFRMVIPLSTPMNHRLFRYKKVKQWFVDKFKGVDALASIKTLQKHKIPAHHPDDTAYRFHINEGYRLELPIDDFAEWAYEEIRDRPSYATKKTYDSVFEIPLEDMYKKRHEERSTEALQEHHMAELKAMSWDRGASNDVHGNLCRIAYSLQMAGVYDWYEIIMSYAPEAYSREVQRMRIR